MSYAETFRQSIEDRESFWTQAAADIHWFTPPAKTLSKDENLFYRWFEGGELNTSYLCLDHHIANGRGEETALIYDSPVTGTTAKFSYGELKQRTAK